MMGEVMIDLGWALVKYVTIPVFIVFLFLLWAGNRRMRKKRLKSNISRRKESGG